LLYCLEKICIQYDVDRDYLHKITIEAEHELNRWKNANSRI